MANKLSEVNKSRIESVTAIAAIVSSFAAILALVLNMYLSHVDKQATIKNEIMQNRRKALFDALQVIDHIYANVSFDNQPPSNPHKWDIQKARDAMNGMIIYCSNPQKAMDSFSKAIGLHNPSVEKEIRIDLKYLDQFRNDVARELELPELKYENPNNTWIYKLAGGQ